MFQHFIGIDVSMDSFNYSVIDNSGKEIDNGACKMNEAGFSTFFSKIKCFKTTFLAVESTSTYHINLITAIAERTSNVAILNPTLVKNFIASSSLRKLKTDKVDAIAIAHFLRERHEKIHSFSLSECPSLFRVARLRESISKEISSTKTNLKQMVRISFPELDKKVNIFTDSMLKLLEKYPSAHTVKAVSAKKFTNFFAKVMKRRGKPVSFKSQDIIDLAEKSIGTSDDMLHQVIKHDIKRLRFLNETIDEVTESLVNEVKKISSKQLEILTSIDGVGEVTASGFIAEIQTIDKFDNPAQLIAFAGTDPGISQSGQSYKRRKISKKGNASIRRLVFIMAVNVIRCNERFKAYFCKKRAEKMPYKKAVIATGNKLLRVMFYLLKREECFAM